LWTGGGFLAHAWSLAIEEQFYLIWPVVVILVMRRRSSPGLVGIIALICALGSAGLRAGLDLVGVDSALLFNATFSHVDGIFAGCALGVAWSMRAPIVDWMARPLFTIVACVAVVVVVIRGQSMNVYGILVTVAATVMVVASLLVRQESAMSKLLSRRAMVETGKRSYGLYLYHWPIFQFIGNHSSPPYLILCFALSFAAAWLSYAFVEQPFLRMKSRWKRGGLAETSGRPAESNAGTPETDR
jgi:peptidoglycan/LPS O-acetylase OafA/YrhL